MKLCKACAQVLKELIDGPGDPSLDVSRIGDAIKETMAEPAKTAKVGKGKAEGVVEGMGV